MNIVVTHVQVSAFSELVTFYHGEGNPKTGHQVFIQLLKLLVRKSFTELLVKFINEYVVHLKRPRGHCWETTLTDRYDYELYLHVENLNISDIISITDMLDFTLLFMELVYDAGIDEIYKLNIKDIEVSKYGKVKVYFKDICLPRSSRKAYRKSILL